MKSCGIVGLPNVGKSTLFNAITHSESAIAANFPFCTIEPNTGIVKIPDERIDKLIKIDNPAKVVPAMIQFVDIAGLVKGASTGEGLGNKFLSHIREVDIIVHVVRCFEKDDVIHVCNRINPVEDKNIIDIELQLKDLESLDNKIDKLKKLTKGGNKDTILELEQAESLKDKVAQGYNIRDIDMTDTQRNIANSLQLLTMKPVIYVANVDEQTLRNGGNKYTNGLKSVLGSNDQMIMLSADLECAFMDASDEEYKALMSEYNINTSGLESLVKASYDTLGLITYFTSGPDEVRAWTIQQGTKAPQAAGIIHSDFERGFIKAEVVQYNDYISYNGEQGCRETGKLHIEGKDYIVHDGDIMHFLFNV